MLFTESWNKFLYISNFDFFVLEYYKSVQVVGTLWAQLLLQLYIDPFETLQVIMVWRYAYAFFTILIFFYFFFPVLNLSQFFLPQ